MELDFDQAVEYDEFSLPCMRIVFLLWLFSFVVVLVVGNFALKRNLIFVTCWCCRGVLRKRRKRTGLKKKSHLICPTLMFLCQKTVLSNARMQAPGPDHPMI